jgi:hypothetical protein
MQPTVTEFVYGDGVTGQSGAQRPLLPDRDGDTLTYASSIGSLVDRTNYWLDQGVLNIARFLTGEVSYEQYRAHEVELLSRLRIEVLRGPTGEILVREGLADLISRLRELDFRAATAAMGLRTLRSHLEAELRQRAISMY